MKKVTVIDYGIGNLLNVVRAFRNRGASVEIAETPAEVEGAERLVLPGVGAFADAMQELDKRGLITPITECAQSGRPFLGICVGMQIMMDYSDEFGETAGLGLLRGGVKPIPAEAAAGARRKIPHVGWAELLPPASGARWEGTILADVKPGESAYFVHSFGAVPEDDEVTLAQCEYEDLRLCAAVRRDNMYGCQFHPEKSGVVGLGIIDCFLELD